METDSPPSRDAEALEATTARHGEGNASVPVAISDKGATCVAGLTRRDKAEEGESRKNRGGKMSARTFRLHLETTDVSHDSTRR